MSINKIQNDNDGHTHEVGRHQGKEGIRVRLCANLKVYENIRNNIILKYVLICGMKRKGMLNKNIKIVVTSVEKSNETEGWLQKEHMGFQGFMMFGS